MSMANANANPVGCGSKGGQPDTLVTDPEAQPHGVHLVPVALYIRVTNDVETADDESHATGVQLDEVTKRRRVVVVDNRWIRGTVYYCSS